MSEKIDFDYVAGFLFNENLSSVALIEKQKPEWQKGKLNAIGGKIELGETPAEAMRREFCEETSVDISDWKSFCVLRGQFESIWRVHFFYAIGDLSKVRTMESEKVGRFATTSILIDSRIPVIPNLKYLIPMALNFAKGVENCSVFQVTEFQ